MFTRGGKAAPQGCESAGRAGAGCIWSTGSRPMRRICSRKRSRSTTDYAPALLGLALVAADGFEGKAAELAQRALESDPKLVEAQELLARVALEDNNSEKAAAEANKALAISPEALDAMAILATIDWLNDKTDYAVDRQNSENQSDVRRSVRDGRAFFRHQPPLRRRRSRRIARRSRSSPIYGARAVELGMNLMRFGEDGEARQQLEEAVSTRAIRAPKPRTR